MKSQIDLSGMRFGRLVVKGISDRKSGPNRLWECICDCGNTAFVRANCLKKGKTQSCGCLSKELSSKRIRENIPQSTHGLSRDENGRTPHLYRVWAAMKRRCQNSNADNYGSYGGRGISVCDEWSSSYLAFHKWAIENGYKEGLTIERKDPNGNYEPGNCRWATKKEQANNRRSSSCVSFNGECLTLSQWAEKTGIPASTIRLRISRLGWPAEKALTTPCQQRRGK